MSEKKVLKVDEVIAPAKKAGRNSHDRSAYDWFETFEATMQATGNITASARQAGVSRTAVYDMRESREDLADRMDEAGEQFLATLELHAQQRAFGGSDVMTIFLLKKLKPDVYGDEINVNLDHSGRVEMGHEFTIIVDGPTLGERDED